MYDNHSLDDDVNYVPDFVRQTSAYLEQDKGKKNDEIKLEEEVQIQQVKSDIDRILNEN